MEIDDAGPGNAPVHSSVIHHVVAVMTRPSDRAPTPDSLTPESSSGERFALYVQPHIPLLFATAYSLTRSNTDAEADRHL